MYAIDYGNWNFIYNAYIWKIAYFCWYRSIFCVFKGVNCNQRIANVYVVFGDKTYRLFVLNQFLWYLCINKHWFSELHATLILTAKTFKNDEKGLRRGVEALLKLVCLHAHCSKKLIHSSSSWLFGLSNFYSLSFLLAFLIRGIKMLWMMLSS